MVASNRASGSTGLRKGDVLKGRYEILNLIGKGGMSRVFLASDRQLTNKQWAVKEVDRRKKDPAGRPIEQSLASEADILSRLDHPNIVNIIDVEKTENFIYIVMDHVPGQTLAELVRTEGPQSEADVQKWMLQICDVMGYLHNQNPPIIYRDMKPANVMLHPDGYVKIIDFGVSREYKDTQNHDTISFGTEGYAPPEAYGNAQTNAASDIYSIGATMWHLLAGEAPSGMPIPDVRTLNPNVGEGFAQVIIPKCTKLDRPLRYQSCEELASDLEIYEELTQEYKSKQKRKVLAFAISAALSVVLALTGVGLMALYGNAVTEKFEEQIKLANNQTQTNPGDATLGIDWENLEEKPGGAEGSYLAAIKLKPGDIEPYEGLIACYEIDGTFSDEEKQQLDEVYQANLSSLETSSQFSQLSYDIGRLYWTFYKRPTTTTTFSSSDDTDSANANRDERIKASVSYFETPKNDDSFELQSRAQIYYGIAQFTADVSNKVAAGEDDEELYVNFWQNLSSLSELLSSESIEKMKLDSCSLIANGMETYMTKFVKSANVSRSDMEKVYNNVLNELKSLETTTTEIETERKTIINRLENEVKPSITVAYSESSVNR